MAFIDEVREQADRLAAFCGQDAGLSGWGARYRRDFDSVVFTGMGSSYSASQLAASLASELGLRAFYGEPDQLQFNLPGLFGPRTLTVAISQSGNSPETVRLAQSLPSGQVLAVVNNDENPLCRHAGHSVFLHAGREAYTASKTYTNSIAAVYRVAETLSDVSSERSVLRDIPLVCQVMRDMIHAPRSIGEEMADFFDDAHDMVVVGSGTSYASATQSDYVIAEMDHLFTKCITAAQFFHGMIESADDSYRVLICDGDDHFRDRTRQLIAALERCGARYYLLTNGDYIGLSPLQAGQTRLPVKSKYLFPLLDVVAIELFGFALGIRRNTKPGELTHVAK